MKLQVCVLSFEGPVTIFVAKFATTIGVLYFVTVTLVLVSVKLGASLTGLTVSTKELVEVAEPSSATRVIVAEPFALVTVVIARVRLVLVPLAATVTKFVSEDVAVTVTVVTSVSTSVRVN